MDPTSPRPPWGRPAGWRRCSTPTCSCSRRRSPSTPRRTSGTCTLHQRPRPAAGERRGRGGWGQAGPAGRCTPGRLSDSVVCMATHGRTGLRAVVLGSVADEVVRDLGDPVVLVGPSFSRAAGRASCSGAGTGPTCRQPSGRSRWRGRPRSTCAPRVLAVRKESEEPILTAASGALLPATEALVATLGAGGGAVELTERSSTSTRPEPWPRVRGRRMPSAWSPWRQGGVASRRDALGRVRRRRSSTGAPDPAHPPPRS